MTDRSSSTRIERFATGLLALNGAALALTGAVQALGDLGSHFLGRGPLAGRLLDSPATIGFFEAHGLAVIVGFLLVARRREGGAGWHLVAAAVHLLLGGANLLLWPAFEAYDMVGPGTVATVAHGLFFSLEVVAAALRSPELVRGPGAGFRLTALITLLSGLLLHGAGLAMGREAFVARLFTPGVDALLAIPMTWAGISGWMLYRRAVLPTVLHRAFLTLMLVYFSISIPIHLRTLLTWRTDYVLAFPDWYSLPIFVLMLGMMAFVLRLRFAPAPARA